MQQKEEDKKVIQFFQGQPGSIYDAITMHSNHIHQMYLAYSYLCNVTKDNTQIGEFTKSDIFEIQLKEAFNDVKSIVSNGFIAYVEQFILNTKDNSLLEKVYNFLTIKLNELQMVPKRVKFNPAYPHYKTLYENANHKLILYLSGLGNELDANGNYKKVKDYFTANDLFDAIVLDLKETKDKIDSLFSLKSLNAIVETLQENNFNSNQQKRIKWEGTPSQFGFIIDLLITGGYLKKPTSSFVKDADFYATIFDIETTPGTLAKELSEKTNSLNTINRKKIVIPPKDDLIS